MEQIQPGNEDRCRSLRRGRKVQAHHLYGREPFREGDTAERQEASSRDIQPLHLQAGYSCEGTLGAGSPHRSDTALCDRGR